jgi:hypothetical protein
MFLQQSAPQGLKRVTTPVHGLQPGKAGMTAAVVAPLDPMGRDAGIVRLFWLIYRHVDSVKHRKTMLLKQVQLQFPLPDMV